MKEFNWRNYASAAALGSLLLWSAVPLIDAQEPGQDRNKAGAPAEVGDQELRSFAKSYLEFHKLRREYEPQMEKASGPQERHRIEQEAVARFNRALEGEGLTLESYVRLYQTISADEQLRAKALNMIEAERKRG
jgi:hypothetical protein